MKSDCLQVIITFFFIHPLVITEINSWSDKEQFLNKNLQKLFKLLGTMNIQIA